MPEYLSIGDAGITALLGYAVVFLGISLLMIVIMIMSGVEFYLAVSQTYLTFLKSTDKALLMSYNYDSYAVSVYRA